MDRINIEQLRTVALLKKQQFTKSIQQLGSADSSPLIESGRTILRELSTYAMKKPLITVTTAAVAGIIADRMLKQVNLISEDQINSAKNEVRVILESAARRHVMGLLKYSLKVASNVLNH